MIITFYETSLILFYKRLIKKIEYFNNGDELIAIDIAIQIRTLVHDSKNQRIKSESLLKKLGKKDILFVSLMDSNWSSGGISNRIFGDNINNITYLQVVPFVSGLLSASHKKEGNKIITEYFPLSFKGKTPVKKLEFDAWWNEEKVAIINDTHEFLTRSDIVYFVANKDGGAHYEDVEKPTKKLKSNNLLGVNINGEIAETMNYPLYPILCQIAYEIIETLNSSHIIESQFKV